MKDERTERPKPSSIPPPSKKRFYICIAFTFTSMHMHMCMPLALLRTPLSPRQQQQQQQLFPSSLALRWFKGGDSWFRNWLAGSAFPV